MIATVMFLIVAAGMLPVPAVAEEPGPVESEDPMRPSSTTIVDAGPDIATTEGASATLAGTAAPGSAVVPLWADSFDSYALGALSPPWVDESGGGTNYAEISNAVVHGPTGRSLRVVDNDVTLGTVAARGLGSVTVVNATVWAYAVQTTGVFTPLVSAGATPDEWQAVRAGMGPTGFFIYRACTGGWTTSTVPYVAGQWYELRFVASALTDTYDFYVDGSLVSGGILLCAPSTAFTTVRMVSAGSFTGEFYVDDVAVEAEQPFTITAYQWDLNGADDANGDTNYTNDPDRLGATILVDFGDSGDYLVTLTVTDSSGFRANDSAIVSVANLQPVVTLSPQTPVSISGGANVTMQGTDEGSDDLTFSWSWNDGPAGGRTFLNGPSPDPPLSPGGIFPFSAMQTTYRTFPSPGVYTITVTVADDDGGSGIAFANIDVRDAPRSMLTIGPPVYIGTSTFINGSSAITLSATDRSGQGIDRTYYRVDGGPPAVYGAPFVLSQRGLHNITYWSTDNLGGIEAPRFSVVNVDLDAPVTTLVLTGPWWSNGTTVWIAPSTQLLLQASDVGSGVAETRHRLWNGVVWTAWSASPSPLSPPVANGSIAVEFYSVDNLGQPEAITNEPFEVDGAPPSSALVLGSPSSGRWVTDATPLTIVSADGSVGVDTITYRSWHAGAWGSILPYLGPFTLTLGEGVYYVEFRGTDRLGNAEPLRNETVMVDLTPPSSSLQLGLPSSGRWVTDATLLAIVSADGGSGVRNITYRIWHAGAWGAPLPYAGPFALTFGEGTYHIEFQAADRLGNWEPLRNESVTVDTTPPTSSLTVGQPSSGEWVTDATPLEVVSSDGGSGVDVVEYRVWHGGAWGPLSPYVGPITLTRGEGVHYVEFQAEDQLGNRESLRNRTFVVDTTAPTSTIAVGQPSFGAWVTSATPFSLASSDGNGVGINRIEVRVWHAGTWTSFAEYDAPFVLDSDEGLYYVEFRAIDLLGNAEVVRNESRSVDNTPPAIDVRIGHSDAEYSFTVTVEAADDGSGVEVVGYRIGTGPWTVYVGPFTVRGKASFLLEVRAADNVGNEGTRALAPLAPQYVNYKPLLSVVLAVVLLITGILLARRRKSRIFYTLMAAFAGVELALGAVSAFADVLLFPPALGAGLWVDLAVTVGGIVAFALYRPRTPLKTDGSQSPTS